MVVIKIWKSGWKEFDLIFLSKNKQIITLNVYFTYDLIKINLIFN